MNSKILHKLKTPRIKALAHHPTKPVIVCALYDGSFTYFSTVENKTVLSVNVSTHTLRSIAFYNNTLLLGCDDGKIYFYENDKRLNSVTVHNDFIRKIAIRNKNVLTCSDDCTIKHWIIKDNTLVLVNTYDTHSHFVMDVVFVSDKSFMSASLDQTVKVWNLDNKKEMVTLNGHTDGVNSVTMSNDYIVTVSDDLTCKIWDNYKSIYTIRGHTKNINKVKDFDNFFITCSEDGYIKTYDKKTWKLDLNLNLGYERVWDVERAGDKLYLGCDDGLVVVSYGKESNFFCMAGNKIYYNTNENLKGTRTGALSIIKDIAFLDFIPSFVKLSNNGKNIAIGSGKEYFLYNCLGFRNRGKGFCNDFFFTENGFVLRNGNEIQILDESQTIQKKHAVKDLEKLIGVKNDSVYAYNSKSKCVLGVNSEKILELDGTFRDAVFMGEYVILIGDYITAYSIDYELANDFIEQGIDCNEIADHYKCIFTANRKVDNFFISGDVLFYSSLGKVYYLVLGESILDYELCLLDGKFVGIYENEIYYYNKKMIAMPYSHDFIDWQKSIVAGIPKEISESFRPQAVQFYIHLQMYDEALSICKDEKIRFDMFIKMKKFEEAFELATSKTKYKTLMREYAKVCNFRKAAECALKASDWENLYLYSTLCGGEFDEELMMKCDSNSIDFLMSYKKDDFARCYELLKHNELGEIFRDNYLE